MATPVIIPKLGNTVESCIIGPWKKKEGEKVKKGDLLLEIETDKTTFEIDAPAGGILLGVFFKEGDIVPVLSNIAVIGNKDEEFESYRPKSKEIKKGPSRQAVKEEKEIPALFIKISRVPQVCEIISNIEETWFLSFISAFNFRILSLNALFSSRNFIQAVSSL